MNHPFKLLLGALFILMISGLFLPTKAAHIVFDLGDVLVTPHKMKAFRSIGFRNIMGNLVRFQRPSAAKESLFDFMHALSDHQVSTHSSDGSGMVLPELMCEWFRGKISASEAHTIAHAAIELNREFFRNAAEVRLVKSLINLIFDPLKLGHLLHLSSGAEKFVNECIEQGHTVYILSNLDKQTIEILKNRYPYFFAKFADRIMISDTTGFIKPEAGIYKHFLDTFDINPHQETCIFIDDQVSNISAARQFNIHGIVCDKKRKGIFGKTPNFNKVRQSLNMHLNQSTKS